MAPPPAVPTPPACSAISTSGGDGPGGPRKASMLVSTDTLLPRQPHTSEKNRPQGQPVPLPNVTPIAQRVQGGDAQIPDVHESQNLRGQRHSQKSDNIPHAATAPLRIVEAPEENLNGGSFPKGKENPKQARISTEEHGQERRMADHRHTLESNDHHPLVDTESLSMTRTVSRVLSRFMSLSSRGSKKMYRRRESEANHAVDLSPLKSCPGRKCEDCIKEVGWKGIVPRRTAEIVKESWDQIHKRYSFAEMADAFFPTLFASQPQLQKLFYRACALAQMFESMNMVLQQLMVDAEVAGKSFDALGVRHLKYNCKMNMFPLVGKEYIATLEELSPPDTFTEEVRAAWTQLWTAATKMFNKYLDVDPIVRAVERGAVDEMRKKLEVTPRGQRIGRLIKKLADGQTPLLRAIRASKLNVVRFMLNDMLAIRSDRTGYYYGRNELFSVHQELVLELVEHCPEALIDLVDGCVWESGHTDGGRVRVIFYLEGLYGHYDQPVFKTPMAALLKLESNEIFTHPLIIELINLKWRQFGFKMFFYQQLIAVLKVTLFIVGYLSMENASRMSRLGVRFVVWAMSTWDLYKTAKILGFMDKQVLSILLEAKDGHMTMMRMLKDTFQQGKWVRLIPNTMVLVMIPFDTNVNHHLGDHGRSVETILTGVVVTVLSLQLLRTFLASKALSAFTYIIERMVYDVFQFFCVFSFIWLAFGLCFHVLLGKQGAAEFKDLWTSMLSLFGMVFGFYEYEFRQRKDPVGVVATLMWLLYLIFVILLMFNLLIAQFANSYNTIKEASHAYTMRMLTDELLTMENSFTRKKRKEMWESMGFDRKLKYDEAVPGPSGGVEVYRLVKSWKYRFPGGERILRYVDRGDPDAPWPLQSSTEGDTTTNSTSHSKHQSKTATPRRLSGDMSGKVALSRSVTKDFSSQPSPSLSPTANLLVGKSDRRKPDSPTTAKAGDAPVQSPPAIGTTRTPSRLGALSSLQQTYPGVPAVIPLLNNFKEQGQGSGMPIMTRAQSMGRFRSADSVEDTVQFPDVNQKVDRRQSEKGMTKDKVEIPADPDDDIPMAVIHKAKVKPKAASSSPSPSTRIGKDGKPLYTLDEVGDHCEENDAWIAIHGQVYDVTQFIPMHPGGEAILTAVGSDGTQSYDEIGHSTYAENLLRNYCIGTLSSEEPAQRGKDTIF